MEYILTPLSVITDKQITYIKSTTAAYPKIYGDKLPDGAKYIDTIILNFKDGTIVWDDTINNNGQLMNDPTNTAQKVRVEGNPEEPNIKKGLESKGDPGGYDIRDVGGRIRMYQDNKGHYQFIDGRTKAKLMDTNDHKSMPVDLYDIEKDKNGDINLSVVRAMGSHFNQKPYARGIVRKEDIQKIILDDFVDGYFKLKDPKDDDNYEENHAKIMAEAKYLGGASYYKSTYQKIAAFVINLLQDNLASKTGVRLQYNEAKAIAKMKQMGIYQNNFKDNGIWYFPCSASTISASFTNAAEKATALENAFHDKNDDSVTSFRELRVVFHTGQISSSDFMASAKKCIDDARRKWADMIREISCAFFHNTDKSSKVVLFGCLPFDQSAGYDINKIVLFTKPNKDNPELSLIGPHKEPIYFNQIDMKKSLDADLNIAA
tara:strand:- start:54 stop:1349 length:1296 start_codon:yes stop_codon:yes gene_type:complete